MLPSLVDITATIQQNRNNMMTDVYYEVPPVGVFHPTETEVKPRDFDVTIERLAFEKDKVQPVSETLDIIG